MPCIDQGEQAGLLGAEGDDVDDEPAINFGHVQLKDPIVGVEEVISDEHGAGAIPASPLRSPKSMSQAEWERHCITHLPFHPGCPWCVAARKPNLPHRPSHEADRITPLSRRRVLLSGRG